QRRRSGRPSARPSSRRWYEDCSGFGAMASARLTRRATLCGGTVAACTQKPRDRAGALIFKHQPLWGDPGPFRELLASFERESGMRVVTEALPNASDVVHQYYVTSLEGGADFDVLVADVVWVAEFARAGWIADLTSAF